MHPPNTMCWNEVLQVRNVLTVQPLCCFIGKQSVFPSLASAKAQLADLGAGDLQAELRVTRRVDERSEWQPSAEI